MSLRHALVAALAAVASVPALATDRASLGDITCASALEPCTGTSGVYAITGAFEDFIPFALTAPNDTSGDPASTKTVSRGKVVSFADNLAIGIVDGSRNALTAMTGADDGIQDVLLSPGNYFFRVTGNGVGQNGKGSYYVTWATAAAVPEPETYALLLAGLGAMFFISRRRNLRD